MHDAGELYLARTASLYVESGIRDHQALPQCVMEGSHYARTQEGQAKRMAKRVQDAWLKAMGLPSSKSPLSPLPQDGIGSPSSLIDKYFGKGKTQCRGAILTSCDPGTHGNLITKIVVITHIRTGCSNIALGLDQNL